MSFSVTVYLKEWKLYNPMISIYSSKFAVILLIILAGIFGLQLLNNSSNSPLIDAETCELYIKDSQINAKQYLKEFDSKCVEFKNLNP
jgi:hypothetical protein